jgi:mannan endo-1,6-alpha-mannosidase
LRLPRESIPLFFSSILVATSVRYTGNDTYAKWAVEAWDWMQGIGLVNKDYNVFDGDHVDKNCTDTNPHINPHQYSYNVGILLQGSAFMYN